MCVSPRGVQVFKQMMFCTSCETCRIETSHTRRFLPFCSECRWSLGGGGVVDWLKSLSRHVNIFTRYGSTRQPFRLRERERGWERPNAEDIPTPTRFWVNSNASECFDQRTEQPRYDGLVVQNSRLILILSMFAHHVCLCLRCFLLPGRGSAAPKYVYLRKIFEIHDSSFFHEALVSSSIYGRHHHGECPPFRVLDGDCLARWSSRSFRRRQLPVATIMVTNLRFFSSRLFLRPVKSLSTWIALCGVASGSYERQGSSPCDLPCPFYVKTTCSICTSP